MKWWLFPFYTAQTELKNLALFLKKSLFLATIITKLRQKGQKKSENHPDKKNKKLLEKFKKNSAYIYRENPKKFLTVISRGSSNVLRSFFQSSHSKIIFEKQQKHGGKQKIERRKYIYSVYFLYFFFVSWMSVPSTEYRCCIRIGQNVRITRGLNEIS